NSVYRRKQIEHCLLLSSLMLRSSSAASGWCGGGPFGRAKSVAVMSATHFFVALACTPGLVEVRQTFVFRDHSTKVETLSRADAASAPGPSPLISGGRASLLHAASASSRARTATGCGSTAAPATT